MGLKEYIVGKAKEVGNFWVGLVKEIYRSNTGYGKTCFGDEGFRLSDTAEDSKLTRLKSENDSLRKSVDGLNRLVSDLTDERNSQKELVDSAFERINYLVDSVDRMERDLKRLENEKGLLKQYSRDSGRRWRRFARMAKDARKNLLNLINSEINNGVNPITQERDGRYAFYDVREKRVTSLSRAAQIATGYEPGEIEISKIISLPALEEIGNAGERKSFSEMHIKVKERDKPIKFKDFSIRPFLVGSENYGLLISFEKLGWIEWVREKIREKLRREQTEKVRKLMNGIPDYGFDG